MLSNHTTQMFSVPTACDSRLSKNSLKLMEFFGLVWTHDLPSFFVN